jgi:hypothetical protein
MYREMKLYTEYLNDRKTFSAGISCGAVGIILYGLVEMMLHCYDGFIRKLKDEWETVMSV